MKLLYKGHIYEATVKDSEYDIEQIKRSPNYEYRNLEGVTYRITRNTEIEQVPISRVALSEDNEFYPAQIEKYVEYIKNGGIIEPFPVEVSKLEYTLDDMLEFLDNNKEFEADIDEAFYGINVPGLVRYRYVDLLTDRDEDEKFFKYRRLNPKANSLFNCFPYSNGPNEEEKTLIPFLTEVFKFFEDNAEYTLINQNHRFEALKKLGKKNVLIRK